MAQSSPADEKVAPLKTLDDLLIPFHEAFKPESRHRIGAEAEKFGVFADTGAPLLYEGEQSVHTIMETLLDEYSFEGPDLAEKSVVVDSDYVNKQLAAIVKNEDLSRYIL